MAYSLMETIPWGEGGGGENAEREHIYPNISPYILIYPYRTLYRVPHYWGVVRPSGEHIPDKMPVVPSKSKPTVGLLGLRVKDLGIWFRSWGLESRI